MLIDSPTSTPPTLASRLIAAVRAAGSDARDLRDAAHEACHALDYGVPVGSWDRITIHDHAPVLHAALRSEVVARAVERIVCERCGEPLTDKAKWLLLAAMETIKTWRVSMPLEVWRNAVDHAESDPAVLALAERVLALIPHAD